MILARRLGAALVVAAATLAAAAGAGAQQLPVRIQGAFEPGLDRRLSRLLERDPLILTAETRVPAGDTLRRSVLLLDATLILEGVIAGDLVVVDGGAFVRPGAVVQGDLVNLGGGLYRSEVSHVGGTLLDRPTAGYRVVREPDRLLIVASDPSSPLTLDGFKGLRPPTYDRVNGLTLAVGARYRVPGLGDVTPSVHGRAGWRTELGEPTYGLSGEIRWGGAALEGGYDAGWSTNDDWIRGDLMNALNYAWDGGDYRDYNESERRWLGVRGSVGDEAKRFQGVARLRGQVEDAASLPGDDPWHLLPGEPRPNPAVDDGRITSVVAGFELAWHGLRTHFEGALEYEVARGWLAGDFTFDRVAAEGDWAMLALADHTLEIEFFVQQPLGGGFLPRQEWSFVGGSGTLQTVEFARFRGDHVVFVESKYIIPFPDRMRVPLLGAPDLELVHAAGMAWTEGEDSALQQEVGVRLQFFGLYFRYMIDPADLGTGDLDIGLSWPFDSPFPWQRP